VGSDTISERGLIAEDTLKIDEAKDPHLQLKSREGAHLKRLFVKKDGEH
jgi:hypothetical protein